MNLNLPKSWQELGNAPSPWVGRSTILPGVAAPACGAGGWAGGAGYISQSARLSSGRRGGADIPNLGLLIVHPGLAEVV